VQRPLGGGLPALQDRFTGVGEKRAAQYGQRFVQAIQSFRESHPEAEPPGSIATQAELQEASAQPAHAPTYVEEARQKHARAYAKWSHEEDESLRRAWDGLADSPESDAAKIRAIACDFDRKPGAIRSRLKKLELLEPAAGIDLRTG